MKTITVTTIKRSTNKKESIIILIDKIIFIQDNPQGGKTLPTTIVLTENKKINVCETKEEVQKMI